MKSDLETDLIIKTPLVEIIYSWLKKNLVKSHYVKSNNI
jgi:hypothetical protein